ncbi:hypothetical protein LLH00_19475 [bacterium]|nr:hypothetical protein [bacterium]
MRWLKRVVLFSAVLLATQVCGAPAAESADDYYMLAVQGFAGADSLNALAQVNRALSLDPNHSRARLLRGNVNLAVGSYVEAWTDFSVAFRDPDPNQKTMAWAGLSDTFTQLRRRRLLNDRFYDESNPLDPAHPEELYAKAQLAYTSDSPEGNRMARSLMLRLVRFNPGYRGVYRMWRELFRDQTLQECQALDSCLVQFLDAHPDSTAWWIELARDRFRLGQTGEALAALDRLEQTNPNFSSPDVPLLRARCKLEQGDERSFQYLYFKALDSAASSGDFASLLRQAEAVFTRNDYDEWQRFGHSGDRAAFLRRFWVRFNSDPFETVNGRLVTHYRRLRFAEQNYSLHNLQSFEIFSRQSGRLGIPQHELSDLGAPVIWEHAINLGFDPRGLLYIRFGAPDSVSCTLLERFPADSLQTWYYGIIPFSFQRLGQAEDFVFRPTQYEKSLADVLRIVQSQRMADPSLHFARDYFEAQFMAPEPGMLEVEFYQDERIPGQSAPRAEVALFDDSWRLVLKRESPVYRETIDRQALWLAVHRLIVKPGRYRYALRLSSGAERWLAQGVLDLAPFPTDSLCLSAVVLGSPPEAGLPEYARGQIALVPRPSTCFSRGETIDVYLELYGLKNSPDSTRSYVEGVLVERLQEGEKKVRKFQDKTSTPLEFEEMTTQTSLRHIFQRIAPGGGGPVVETFTLETEGLLPGSYRLVIQTRDLEGGGWDIEETFFDIAADSAQDTR